ncbi:hypothetical protein H5410_047011 [Solanum commersonii]|uniref:Uncharacterized protein n=1 Tax=Solanum commersonii TaxID=4109 RepID=A0A9J5XDU3_SOLCO|nr:hypothetical protein H5410_047011 [Solanum commersonii]
MWDNLFVTITDLGHCALDDDKWHNLVSYGEHPKAQAVRTLLWYGKLVHLGRSAFLVPLPKFSGNGHFAEHRFFNNRPTSVHPMPSTDIDESKEDRLYSTGVASSMGLFACSQLCLESANKVVFSQMVLMDDLIEEAKIAIKVVPGSSNSHASGSLMEQTAQQFPEVKRRKRHRRKHFENQEPCLMRGVYFKNMKWQAAIKVDKKQIHLGTVGTQEEAARLYDRLVPYWYLIRWGFLGFIYQFSEIYSNKILVQFYCY